jgi:hypothetical protein
VQCTQFVKLARDCQLVGSTLSEADPPLLEADIQVAYTAEVKRHDRGAGSLQKMNYNDFLTAMMKIAIKVYPRSRTGVCRTSLHGRRSHGIHAFGVSTLRLHAPSPRMRDLSVSRVARHCLCCVVVLSSATSLAPASACTRAVDEAFQRLLMDNVLPLASRRCPDNIDMFLESEDVQVRCYSKAGSSGLRQQQGWQRGVVAVVAVAELILLRCGGMCTDGSELTKTS